MAFAVDTKYLLDKYTPRQEMYFNYYDLHRVDRNKGRRLQLHRVCAYAIIIHDASTRAQFDEGCGFHDPRQEEALNRQPGRVGGIVPSQTTR